MHTEHELVLCPECGTKVMETVRHNGFRVDSTPIGPASIPCPGCGIGIITGQSEWDDKTILQRARFIIQRIFWLLAGSLAIGSVCALIATYIAVEYWFLNRREQEQCQLVTFGIITGLLACQFLKNAASEIRDSRRRTAAARDQST